MPLHSTYPLSAQSSTGELVQTFTSPGPLAVATGAVRFRLPFHATLVNVTATVGTPSQGASVIVDVNRNGVTMFTTQANRPTILEFTRHSSVATPAATGLSAGDDITIDIDQVGSTVVGSDLTVTLYLTKASSAAAPLGIDFVGASPPNTAPNGAGGQNFSVARPPGTATGDIILCVVTLYDANPASFAITPASGWTEVEAGTLQSATTNDFILHWYWRRDDGTAGPWTFTISSTVGWRDWFTLSYRGAVASGSPIDAYAFAASTSSNASLTGPAVTTTVAYDRLVLVGANDLGTGFQVTADPVGMERRIHPTGGLAVGLYAADEQLQAAGVTGSRVATANASRWTAAGLIALKKS